MLFMDGANRDTDVKPVFAIGSKGAAGAANEVEGEGRANVAVGR